MAVPPESVERRLSLRRFIGTQTQLDSTFLGPQFLRYSQNWAPDRTFRLSTRPGHVPYLSAPGTPLRLTYLLSTLAGITRYLYAYAQHATNDYLVVSVNDGAFALVPGGTFASGPHVGRIVRVGNFLYAANDVDPPLRVPLGGTGVSLGALATTNTVGSAVAPVTIAAGDATPRILTGTYSYAWAVFDTVTGLYVSRGIPGTVTIEKDQFLTTTSPTAALPAGQVYRFFMTALNLPIEFATAQNATYGPAQTLTRGNPDVSDDPVPLANGLVRTGGLMLVRGNRVLFAGSEADPMAVNATAVLLQGREQAVHNRGAFFPAFARISVPSDVTALGLATVSDRADPRSPLIIFERGAMTMYTGDPFGGGAPAERIELSKQVGCSSPDSVCATPVGLLFLGPDSIYLVPPGGGFPVDVGWPIGDQLRLLDPPTRTDVVGWYHKGFYKLDLGVLGQWWLDLRRGVSDVPSWWGPHQGISAGAAAVASHDPAEPERAYIAARTGPETFLTHQEAIVRDAGTLITSVLRTGDLDDGDPFQMKTWTRLRAIGTADDDTSLGIAFRTDSGIVWPLDPMRFMTRTGEAIWNVSDWNTAQWVVTTTEEVQTIADDPRPFGLTCEVMATHSADARVSIRDLELLYLPSGRKVRYVGERDEGST